MEFDRIAHELLKEVIDKGRIREDTVAYCAALKCMAVGCTSLTPTQQPIYYL